MKTLYLDAKKGIYRGTSVSFMVLIFGALGAGFFFFLQNFLKLNHVLGAVEAINEPTLWHILFWATDFFFIIMAVVTAYSIAGIAAVAPSLSLSIYFAHFTFQNVSAENSYICYFSTPFGYQNSTSIGYMGYLILAVFLALGIKILFSAWDNVKTPVGKWLDKILVSLKKKIKLIPAELTGKETIEGLDLIVLILIMPVISCALTFLLLKYGIQLPFAKISEALGTALSSLTSSNIVLSALVIGLMIGFDVIGPVSLAAYGVATAAYLDSGDAQLITIYSASFVTVGWTAFFAILFCKIFKKGKTDTDDFNMATSGPINAFFENLKLTTLFALPMAARSPFSFIPGYMVGSGVTGLLTAIFKIVNTAYTDGTLPKYTSGFYSYGAKDWTYADLFRNGELYMGFSLPLRSGDWLSCRIPLAAFILIGGIVGGFVIMGLLALQTKILDKHGLCYEANGDIIIEMRNTAKQFADKLKGKYSDEKEVEKVG